MIDQDIIDLLDSPEAALRAKAVKALARTKDEEALKYLQTLEKTDDDPEVRELARKAILYVRKHLESSKWQSDPVESPPSREPEPEEVAVSAGNVEAAKGYVNTAMNLHISGDDQKAAQMLEKAFRSNPNLRNDSYTIGLAATIAGVSEEQAVSSLRDGDSPDWVSSLPAGGKPKRKRKGGEEEVTWEQAIIDMVIYWMVNAGILIVSMLIQFQLLGSLFSEFQNQFAGEFGSYAYDPQMQAFMSAMIGASVVGSIIQGFLYASLSVVMLLIMYGFIHLASVHLLGGDGTLRGLIHKATNFITFFTAGYFLIGMVFTYSLFNALLSINYEEVAPGYNPFDNISGGVTLLPWAMFAASLFYLYGLGKRIGDNYRYGTGRGCVSLILYTAFMFACACAFYFVALNAILNALVGSGSFDYSQF